MKIKKKHYYILEIVIAFAVYDLINFIFFRGDPGFTKMYLHPYWVVVLLISCRYGFIPGLAAGMTAALQLLFLVLPELPSRAGIEALIESGAFFLPGAFVITGVGLGLLRQRYIDSEEEKKSALLVLKDEMSKFKEMMDASERARRMLEARIVGETSTVKTIYQAARKLESLQADKIYNGCLEILEEHFQVGKSSLYLKEGEYLVLKASRGLTKSEMVEAKITARKSIMGIVMENGQTLTVKDILRLKESQKYLDEYGRVLCMFPIKNEQNAVEGVVNIEKIDFLMLNKSNLELMELIVDWTGRALYNKNLCDLAAQKIFWDQEYDIFNYAFLFTALESEFRRAQKFGTPFTMTLVKLERFGFLNKAAKDIFYRGAISLLKRYFSDTTEIFSYKFEGMLVLLCPMQKPEDLKGPFDELQRDLKEILAKAGAADEKMNISYFSVEAKQGIATSLEMLDLCQRAMRQNG